MPRETLEDKAKRVLVEGRLQVIRIDPDGNILARVHGLSGAHYVCGFVTEEGRAGCTCKASSDFGRECYHLRALWMVVSRPEIKRLRRSA